MISFMRRQTVITRKRFFERMAPMLAAVGAVAGFLSPACRASDRTEAIEELTSLATTGKNIVLILSDTHRLDHVSGFVSEAGSHTPSISALARDGIRFTHAYTPVPISAPAYASLLTGLLPNEHGLLNNQQHLEPTLQLLPESLLREGYRTAAVVANPFCSSGYGFGRGFDFFWDKIDGRGKEGDIITDEVIRWLDTSAGDSPFFLFVAYMDAHTPYISDGIPPSLRLEVNGDWVRDEHAENAHVEQRYPLDLKPGRNVITLSFLEEGQPASPDTAPSPLHLKGLALASGRQLVRSTGIVKIPDTAFERLDNRAVLTVNNTRPISVTDELVFRCWRKYRPDKVPGFYDAGVRSFDRAAGRLLDHLRDLGLYDDTVVIFVSDHGEMLGEHEAWGHVPHLYQETLRIPLLIRAPGLRGGGVDSTPLDLRDLHDMVLDLAIGSDAKRTRSLQARRRAPLTATTYPPEAPHLQATAIRGQLKVITSSDGSEQAFDLEADPDEEINILELRADETEINELLTVARATLASAADVKTLDVTSLTAKERDMLRALGYLDSTP
jgi:arylsulfatase A-like enzyme